MRAKHFAITLAVAIAVPAASVAASTPMCTAGASTAESYRWDFKAEASRLLAGIQDDALNLKTHATNLQSYADDPTLSWEAYAGQYSRVRDDVNDMGAKLCRLEQIRRVALPWQQKAIDRSAALIRVMAGDTQNAITFLNRYQDRMWQPEYQQYATDLYNTAARLSSSLSEFQEFATLQQQETKLSHELKVGS